MMSPESNKAINDCLKAALCIAYTWTEGDDRVAHMHEIVQVRLEALVAAGAAKGWLYPMHPVASDE